MKCQLHEKEVTETFNASQGSVRDFPDTNINFEQSECKLVELSFSMAFGDNKINFCRIDFKQVEIRYSGVSEVIDPGNDDQKSIGSIPRKKSSSLDVQLMGRETSSTPSLPLPSPSPFSVIAFFWD